MLTAQEVIGTRDARTERVDAVFATYDKPDSPGCAVGVYRDGQIAYARGYGLADLERRVPITPHTVFDLGSTSKQFTASSILLLAQDGKLSLDDDVRRWIPELPQYARPITLRNLLNHTSGIRDYIGLMTLGGARIDDVTTEEDALAAIVRQRETNFAPGDEFLYSNSGYFLLAEIVKRASGMHLRQFAKERIFAPLGMRRTHILSDYADVVPDRALAYAPRDEGGYRTDLPRWLQTGDGAVFSTVEELLLWDGNFYDPRVGGQALLTGLQTVGTLTSGRQLDYAAGLMIGSHRGMRTVRHGGAWGGYRAELLRVPDAHLSVAVLCNLGTSSPERMATSVAEIYLENRMEPAAPRPQAPSATASAPAAPAVRVAPERLQALAGLYRDPVTRATRTITFTDGKLWVGVGNRFELRPLSEAEFEAVSAPVRMHVRFAPAAAGQPARLTWSQDGAEPLTAEKLALVTPTPDELAAYTGAYFSEELQTTYRLTVENGALTMHVRGSGPIPLRPLVRDEFTAGLTLRFARDASGAVTGFALDAGRVRNLRFTRTGA
ncbi:serine hydrolase domain-containing protein [Longimicrobium sp.]|uniref:serine hydrolase domain-containing protein n=1 Tax=Longimicrobium sp. TaxID=2029185 RepID=UPI002E37F3E1|nr:serine hydrolase domain-containing protein [Longimicrobium sp.]HEX6038131.1 serine hydrolase domain-containing protein [Longimicrobium sp.]